MRQLRPHVRKKYNLLVVTILLISVLASTVALSQRANLSSKAEPSKVTDGNFEPTVNPWGDALAWKKAPNPSLPVSVGGAGLKHYVGKNQNGSYMYPDPNGAIKEALAQYYAKTNSGYVYLDSYEPHSEGIDPKSVAVITRAKQINPAIKFLGYYVQWEATPGWGEIVTRADTEQHFEDFFVHREGSPATKANRITARPDKPEWGVVPLLDITNPSVRAFVVPKLIEAIQAAKMDGVMNDGLGYNAANAFNPTQHFPNNIMPAATKAAWPGAMAQFVQDIRTQMNGKNLEIFGNVDDDAPQFAQNDLIRAGRLDGVIFEDPFNGRPDPNGLTKVAGLMAYIDSVGKKAIHIISGAHNSTAFGSTNQSEETLAHRYFLAAYMLVMRNGNNMFEYHYPTSIFHQYNSQAFFREWDLNLGAATSGIEDVGSGVLVRKFQKGYVFWNPTASNFTIQGGSGLYHIDNGQNIAGQVVPARAGAFFVTQDVLNEYNTAPSPPSPVPTIASPVVLVGRAECFGGKPRVVLTWNFVYFQNAEIFKNPDPLNGVTVSGVFDRNTTPLYDVGTFSPVRGNTDYTYYLRILDGEAANTTTNSVTLHTPSDASCAFTPTPTLALVPGDVDGNGAVNLLDYVLLFQSYQKPTSDPLYDARADFNHDNKVNMLDYVILFENFGQ